MTESTSVSTPGASTAPQLAPRFRPVLVMFVIFPLFGLVVALATASSRPTNTVLPVAPDVSYIPAQLVGTIAPDFTLKTPTGDTVTLSKLRGQIVFLNFWATWCTLCQEQMPAFQQLISGQIPGRATVLAVDADPTESAHDILQFETKLGVHVPAALDPDSTVNNAYQILAKPHTFIIDPQGVIRYDQLGAMTPDLIRAYIAKLSGSTPAWTYF
ncbi:MAG: TlpA family protein disulfide reductase [Aggregatilineales bacterium]